MEKIKKFMKDMKPYNTTKPTTHDDTHPHPERAVPTTGDDRHPSIHESTKFGTMGPAGNDKPSSERRRPSLIDRLINGPAGGDGPPPKRRDSKTTGDDTHKDSERRRSSTGSGGGRRRSLVEKLGLGSFDGRKATSPTRTQPTTTTGDEILPAGQNPTQESSAGPGNTTGSPRRGSGVKPDYSTMQPPYP